jgi:hypothetical protein
MGDVVDLAGWRPAGRGSGVTRSPEDVGQAPGVGGVAWHPSFGGALGAAAQTSPTNQAIATGPDAQVRLERAVGRLDRVAGLALRTRGALAPELETELYALIGQVHMGLVSEAADRAERLAARMGPARVRTR